MEKVSVIIPSFNRFNSLLNSILSIQQQTYKNIEIIIINDGSTQKEYYEHDWSSQHNIKIIHIDNTKEKYHHLFKESCIGYVRNIGIHISQGFYIAFCDDDDIWFPNKIQSQIIAMKTYQCQMSATDGLIGSGVFNSNSYYPKYNSEYFYNDIQTIHRSKGSLLMENGFPNIWVLDFISYHNSIITSSVIIEKNILPLFRQVTNIAEDYDCWLQALQYTNCIYLNDVHFYYRTD